MSLEGSLTPASNLGGSVEITTLSIMDAARFGFDPDATASDNVTALQAALDIGGIITVRKSGTYNMNATIFIGSNTKIIFSEGVILKKTASYSNVIRNKGAITKTYNENIEIEGLRISVNGYDIQSSDLSQLRGILGFYYVKNLIIKRFKCLDLGSFQFCIQIVKWENIIFDDIQIEGEKDGIDLGTGHGALLTNIRLKTHDDGLVLYCLGYNRVTLDVGDIYDVVYRDVIDNVKDGTGMVLRPMPASWADWSNGNTYKTSDLCVNVGNLYICDNDAGFSHVGSNAPVHGSGSVTGADTIIWRYLHACDYYHADIYNVTLDNFICKDKRRLLNVNFLDDVNMRSAYPGTETLSSVYGFKIINSTIKDIETYLIEAPANLKDVLISNCIIDNVSRLLMLSPGSSNTNIDITVTGCFLKNQDSTAYIRARKPNEAVSIVFAGNRYENFTFKLDVVDATLRIINDSLPLYFDDLSKLTPVIGDMCNTTQGMYVYKADDYWESLSAIFSNDEITNGGFNSDTDWTKQTGWTISGGKAHCDGSQAGVSMLYQAGAKTVGKYYQYVFTISNYSAGSIKIREGTTYGIAHSANGTYTEIIEQTSNYDYNVIVADVDFVGSIDVVMVKRVVN